MSRTKINPYSLYAMVISQIVLLAMIICFTITQHSNLSTTTLSMFIFVEALLTLVIITGIKTIKITKQRNKLIDKLEKTQNTEATQ
ncbi:hypothetical protein [Candidatus Bathycorpusculum sp.]|uniref:hypothetical protein n=1 Tax=Candidatus Bathycorpusculum sp. TaxID=2994959 RepID=UPI0028336D1F|nr:hypothetical protein [Candidatus Termitimicrobium sp.]MCL2686096.1 hypothetical protein [Candidatus Termitimicrobium sp.]